MTKKTHVPHFSCDNPWHLNPQIIRLITTGRRTGQKYVLYASCMAGKQWPCEMVQTENEGEFCDSDHHCHRDRSIRAEQLNTKGCINLLAVMCGNGPGRKSEGSKFQVTIAEWLQIPFANYLTKGN